MRCKLSDRRAAAVVVAAAFGLAGTPVATANPYEDFHRGIFLGYANAPGENQNITRVPKLRISFGDAPTEIVMDTGSTGILVSASRIPNIDALPSHGDGRLTYSSSGRVMIGRWVVTPVTLIGANGATARTAPMPVLAVTRIECTRWARRCTPSDNPRGVAMMGVGFGREHDHQTQSGPDRNPFLRIAHIAERANDGEGTHAMRRGYIVTRRGVHLGLTAGNTRGAFHWLQLARMDNGRDWRETPACISVNNGKAACGAMLVDTGITTMFLTVPEDQAAGALRRGPNRSITLAAGSKVAITAGATDAPQASYTFAVGDRRNPMAPDRITFIRRSGGAAFVNTGVHFLNGFDYLFDNDGGRVGFRRIGGGPEHHGPALSAGRDDAGPGLTEGRR
ncbi:MAG TPA: hypothetical protein VFB68_06150 [Xanthobacteraceae bacterium]|nr:hypothetical protein [Xanthobacteraceae bacterium]